MFFLFIYLRQSLCQCLNVIVMSLALVTLSAYKWPPWRAKPLALLSAAVPPRQKLITSFRSWLNVCLCGLSARLRLQTDPLAFWWNSFSAPPSRCELLSALLSMSRRYEAAFNGGRQLTKKLALIIDWTINGAIRWVCVSPHTWWTEGEESRRKYSHQYSKCTRDAG